MDALAVNVTAVVETVVARTVTALVSSCAKQIGAFVNAALKVSVQVVEGTVPTVTRPTMSLPTMLGDVPQEESAGAVPVYSACPLISAALLAPAPVGASTLRPT